MKEFLQWAIFAGVGVALFFFGLISARRERKIMSHSAPSAHSKLDRSELHSPAYR
jgi:hypothetical protein